MARRRHRGREVHGILLLDKPQGITSNKALQKVKYLYHAAKAGHTGSLDPLATGMLPICFGEATKISNYLLNADKAYEVSCQLGVRTDSADADGIVIETREVPPLNEARINEVLSGFKGEISQVPPMHSALKQNGVPLYKLAHQGIEVQREARQVTIYDLQLCQLASPSMSLKVRCSKGTYVRTLVEDIGEALGCGAHITALRRTQVGPFQDQGMVSMQTLEQYAETKQGQLDQCLLPIDDGLSDWPAINLSANAGFYLQQGQAVFLPNISGQGYVRLYDVNQQFIGIGEILSDGKIAPKRLMNIAKMG